MLLLFQDIHVKGDEIINESGRTRSQKKINPNQWTNIPVLAKIFKLLVIVQTSN